MEYWTIIDDRHAGPFSADELIANGIDLDTPVWVTGLPDWVEAREIPDLRLLLEARAHAPQPPCPQPPMQPQQPQQPPVQPQPAPQAPFQPQQPPVQPQPAPQAPFQPQQPPVQPQPWSQHGSVVPGAPGTQPTPEEAPPAYLVWAIITTVLCCIPLGIPAIIFSTKTKDAIRTGNLAKARKMSEYTQWCIILGIVLGLISMPLQIVLSSI